MNLLLIAIVGLMFASGPESGVSQYEPHAGDIIFQTSMSAQSLAVQKATHSPYSHMGMVILGARGPVVLEAIGPVTLTPLDQWIARGEGHHYVAKRLREAETVLTPAAVERLRAVGEKYIGKAYDSTFEWSDDRFYCSELVWKVYKRALDLEIGRLQHLSDFDLSDPDVRAKVRERWHGPPPAKEQASSPGQMFDSPLLRTVDEN